MNTFQSLPRRALALICCATLLACSGRKGSETPPLPEGNVDDTAALRLLLDANGQPDVANIQRLAARFRSLPPGQQETVAANLSTRVELGAADISGLSSAAGGQEVLLAALSAAAEQIRARALAASIKLAAHSPGEPSPQANVRPVAMLRLAHFLPTQLGPQAQVGGATGVGLFMGYMTLGLIGPAVIASGNDVKPGENNVTNGDGLSASSSIQQASAEITYKGQHEGVDIEFLVKANAHPCPEPDGSFSIDAKVEVKTSKGDAGQNTTMDVKVVGTVGDDAELASRHTELRTQWSESTSGRGRFLDLTMSGTYGTEKLAVNRTGGKATAGEFTQDAIGTTVFIGGLVAQKLLDATEKAWKSGRCVTLTIKPSDGPGGLETSQVVSALAQPRSKIDGQPTGGKVMATLASGGAAVEPSGSPVPADATFRYTAPDEQKTSGTVSFESRSRRGVGKAEVRFSTERLAAYQVIGGLGDEHFDMKVCDVTAPFTLKGSVLTMNFSPSGDTAGTAVATGRPGGASFSSKGTYDINLPEGFGHDGSMTASMSTFVVAGPVSANASQTVRFKLVALDPNEC